ncbi:MAG: HDOD domain-containing protein [Betaproteobacteria bacterium]|nr:MAG: HDOD domain-containing protein [Betaproteobacteria bacterium]
MDPAANMDLDLAGLMQSVEAGVPVLRATAAELARMEREQDRISGNALSGVILRDPLMTLRVLRFLHGHRTRSQTADITTIAHAIMMMGLARFFREFGALAVLEEQAKLGTQTLARLHAAMSRARLAALFARDWAVHRHDLDPEEVMVAALLHDVAELLVLLRWPDAALQTAPAELRAKLFERLGLPGLIRELTEDDQTQNPRVLSVRYACELSRHCAAGWHDPAIGEDLARVQRLLHVSAAEIWERVRRVALQAAREWQVYGVRPAAAHLPMLPEYPDPGPAPA